MSLKTHRIIGEQEAIEFARILASTGRRVFVSKHTDDTFFVRVGFAPAEGTPFAEVNTTIEYKQ